LGFLALAGCTHGARVQGQLSGPTLYEQVGFVPASLRESSGLALSRRNPGVLWSHNDSGDDEIIYATNEAGEELARFDVPGSNHEDWEDISLGPCPDAERDCLYIGDVGDNRARRETVDVYVVPEPDVSVTDRGKRGETEQALHLRIRYPDGPKDVEAMALDSHGRLLFVSKGRRGPIVLYSIDREAMEPEAEIIPRMLGELPFAPARQLGRWVTGMAISPNGQTAVVRTYTELYFFKVDITGTLLPLGDSCFIGATEPQGEAVDFIDNETVLLTSETIPGRRGPITRVRCDTTAAQDS